MIPDSKARRCSPSIVVLVLTIVAASARAEPPDPDLTAEQLSYESARNARIGGLVFLGLTAAAGAGCVWGWSRASDAADSAAVQPLPVDLTERRRLVDDGALGNGVALTSLVVGLASAGISLWLLGSEP